MTRRWIAGGVVLLLAAAPAAAQDYAPPTTPAPPPPPPPAVQYAPLPSFEPVAAPQPVPAPPPPAGAPQASSAGDGQDFALLHDLMVEGVSTKSEPISRFPEGDLTRLGRPTGILEVSARRKGDMTSGVSFPCTAWLIDDAVVLTAWHCMPGLPAGMREQGYEPTRATVSFLYDSETSVPDVYPVRSVIASDMALDYAVLELGVANGRRAPGALYGVYKLAGDYRPGPGTPLQLFHHPYGYFKMVLKDPTCQSFAPQGGLDTKLYHQCDTRGGSSGAPVLLYESADDQAGNHYPVAVGLHARGNANGLADPVRDYNTATSIAAIVQSNDYLRKIACERAAGSFSCPDTALARPVIVYFDRDRSDIRPDAAAELDRVAQLLTTRGWSELSIAGHVDGVYSAAYAVGISQREADSVKAYLVSKGVDPAKITTQAFGVSQPRVSAPAGASEPRNRRVEISVQ